MTRNIKISASIALALGLALRADAQIGLVTAAGNRFLNSTNLPGEKCQAGEVLSINVYTYVHDSLITSTARDMGGPQEVTLPTMDELKASGNVPAVFDALYLMANGDSATVFMPVDSAMAANIPPTFGPVKEIRFDVVVKNRKSLAEVAAKAAEDQKKGAAAIARLPEVQQNIKTWQADYAAKKLGDKLQKTASGLEYIILDPGKGAPLQQGQSVPTHYYGALLADGAPFDNSFERGESIPFTIGQMIPGFDEGLLLLKPGGRAVFFIPYALGYGEEGIPGGPIPAKADLLFYVELQ